MITRIKKGEVYKVIDKINDVAYIEQAKFDTEIRHLYKNVQIIILQDVNHDLDNRVYLYAKPKRKYTEADFE